MSILRDAVKAYPYLTVFNYRSEIDVHMVPFTKGLSMTELAQKLEIPPSRILVIGNGHNDMSMMNSSLAKHAACPANADPEVIDAVHKMGGHIASAPTLGGVIEILSAYNTGKISSALPPDWVPPEEQENPMRKPHQHRSNRALTSLLLLIAAIYATLLVFASFHLLGHFSAKVLKPYLNLIRFIQDALSTLRSI
jgi:hypothetical protein